MEASECVQETFPMIAILSKETIELKFIAATLEDI